MQFRHCSVVVNASLMELRYLQIGIAIVPRSWLRTLTSSYQMQRIHRCTRSHSQRHSRGNKELFPRSEAKTRRSKSLCFFADTQHRARVIRRKNSVKHIRTFFLGAGYGIRTIKGETSQSLRTRFHRETPFSATLCCSLIKPLHLLSSPPRRERFLALCKSGFSYRKTLCLSTCRTGLSLYVRVFCFLIKSIYELRDLSVYFAATSLDSSELFELCRRNEL